jgi:hypothetical protein
VTLTELMAGMAIMAIVSVAFTSVLRFMVKNTMTARNAGEGQEAVRQGLMKAERLLVHADEVRIASPTLVEFVLDLDMSPGYDANGDRDGDGVPDYRDGDRDNDVSLLDSATAQWRHGYNLKDDDEDGDGKIDVRRRLYLDAASRKLYSDMSINEAAWGGQYLQTVMADVSSFTLTYFGNKANALGRNIDANGDGIISSNEMDSVTPASGMGDNNGKLDTANEKRYVTMMRIYLASDRNRDNKTDYGVETDVYPPLLPLKSR